MAAPTLTSSTTSTYSDNVNTDEVTGTLTWNSGDRILVVAATEDQGFTLNTPTATGLTFSALGTAITVSNSCWLHAWTATAGSSGSGTITATRATGTGVAMRGISAFAFGGCTGFARTNKGGGSGSVNSTEVVSVTRTQANSFIVAWAGDWSASGTTGIGWTPAGVTQVIAQTNTGATMVVGRWGDQGATGTADYGTTGLAGTAFTVAAVEVLGTVSSSTTASAENSPGTGTANAPVPAVGTLPATGDGAGTANQPVGVAAGNSEAAGGAGAANAPAAVSGAGSQSAGASGAAQDAGTAVVALAEVAAAAGTAYDATADTGAGGGTQTLFTSQTPALGDNSDGTPGITFGTTLRFAQDGVVPGIRFYATSTVSGTYTAALYAVDSSDPGTGTALASKVLGSAPTGGAWNTITFDDPVAVTANTLYRAAVHSSAGRYVATLNFFTTDLVSGDITADADGDTIGSLNINQGTFRIDASIGYPNSDGNGASYFVDAEFTTESAPATEAPAEVAAGTGTAYDATVSAIAAGQAPAEVAAGTADANQPGLAVVALAEVAAGTGTAYAVAVGEPGGVQTLFTNQTPTLGDNSDGAPGITVGTTLRFAVDGLVTGVRFYSTSTVGGTYTGAFYQVQASDPGSGTALASKVLSGSPSAASWTTIEFDDPVPVTAGTAYRTAVHNSQGRYVATTGMFATDLVEGDITADADGDTVGGYSINQGTYRIDASVGYPNSDGNGTSYFVDVEFVTGQDVTVTAEVASAAGAALFDAGTEVTLTLVSDAPIDAPGTAYAPALVLAGSAENATGSGAANQPVLAGTARAEVASAAGTAYNATVAAVSAVVASAEAATAAGAALSGTARVSPATDDAAQAAGTALEATALAGALAGEGAAAGSAGQPGVLAEPGLAAALSAASGLAATAQADRFATVALSAASGLTAPGIADIRASTVVLSAASGLGATAARNHAAAATLTAASGMVAAGTVADPAPVIAYAHTITIVRSLGTVRRTVPA